MIAKGPKVGRLFPLHVSPSTSFSSFPLLSFACNFIGSGNKRWHKHLGHPNSDVLCTLINSGLLGNKACYFLDLSFYCTSCKLGKSKVLPFPHHASRASRCFDIIHSDVWGIAPIVIKPGPGVDPAKGPGPGFHGSTRVNSGQPGKIKKN